MATDMNGVVTKAILGDEDNEVVKAGTLAVTRGAGVVAAAFTVGANLTPLGDSLDTEQRLWLSIAVGFGWVVLAAADALTRGYVTAHATRRVTTRLNPPLRVSVPGRPADEEDGWAAHLVRADDRDGGVEYFVVRNGEASWMPQDGLRFGVRR